MDDIRLAELQMISIDRFFNLQDYSKYKLIVNDDNGKDIAKHFESFALRSVSQDFRDRFEITVAEPGVSTGWKTQQLLKLFTVADSASDWVLMLDSKNHYLRPVGSGDLFAAGNAKIFFRKPSGKQAEWLDGSLEFYGIEPNTEKTLPTITPYMLKPEVVKLMLDDLCEKLSVTRGDIRLDQGPLKGTTEFFLYYSFMKKHKLIEKYYSPADKMGETLFTKWPTAPEVTRRYLGEAIAGRHMYFGLHRRRIPLLSDSEKRLLAEVWEPLNLPQPASYYLNTPTSNSVIRS